MASVGRGNAKRFSLQGPTGGMGGARTDRDTPQQDPSFFIIIKEEEMLTVEFNIFIYYNAS